MNKKSSKISTSNENYSHLELINLGKIFLKKRSLLIFVPKEIEVGLKLSKILT